MDAPISQQPTGNDGEQKNPIVPTPRISQSEQEECTQSSGTYKQVSHPKRYNAINKRWKELRSASIDRQIELALGLIVVLFAGAQVVNSCSTSDQYDKLISAAQRNERASTKSATAAQQIVTASQRNAAAAENFVTAASNINSGVGNAVTQLGIQAGATKSAAETADQALHVSERAYLFIATPTIDWDIHEVKIMVANNGHIPTGKIDGATHQATFPIAVPGTLVLDVKPDDFRWSPVKSSSIANASQMGIGVPVPNLVREKYELGFQEFIIAGFITYTDGFPKAPKETVPICFRSEWHSLLKQPFIQSCDASDFLPKLEKLDGYPNNEQK
jgi:hypothetical protein